VNNHLPYQLLADVVLMLHVGIVMFVMGGLLLIIIGNLLSWHRVNNVWFRLAHLLAITVVLLQAWLGALCPLTYLEMWLRTKAQATTYTGGFIQYWLQRLLYFDVPSWVFVFAYTIFGVLVLVVWWVYPPSFKRRK
jgi:hypothetical protein